MTAYVDPSIEYGELARSRGLRQTRWCHLTADTEAELHAFAARLGLRREWYQKRGDDDHRWHYDLTVGRRVRAVELGAVELTWREMGELVASRRGARRVAGARPDLVILDEVAETERGAE